MKRLMVLCIFGAALFATNANAATYFKWDVENDIYPYFGGTERDCAQKHFGNCSMRLNVRGNDSGNQQMGVDVGLLTYPFKFVGSPALYYRWWMRIDPGFSWGIRTAKTKSSRTGGGPVTNGSMATQGYTGYLMSNGFLIGECDSAGCRTNTGAANTDDNLIIPYNFKNDGLWHEYIVKIKPNTLATSSDAQFEAWVDGVSVGNHNNFKLHNIATGNLVEGWGGWMVTPYFQLNGTASDGGIIHVDDFSTDTEYNSLVNPGARPNPPTNLSVVPL